MSYLVLARKYRPQRFSEVVGQSAVVKTIVNALKKNKLSHALLFAGIKGTGKTTLARIVAKALNCQNINPEEYEPCNQCQSCVEITKGIHVDVLEIDAASNRGIDQIREIIEALKYAPAKGKAKVYIIDEAHMLTKEASNALLKSLEEPPSHVYFILATTEPNRLPPTILSRCQRYEFRRLDFKLIFNHLQRICELENYQIEQPALELIAREAQGSLRDALSLLDQAMAYGVRTKEDLLYSFGWHEEIIFEDLAKALIERDLKKAMELVQNLYEKGVDIISFTERLTHLFRELFLAKIFSQEVLADKVIDFRLLKDLLFLGNKEDFLLIYQALYKGLEAIRRSTYPQFQFELMIAKICEYEKFISIDTLLERLPTEALVAPELKQEGKVEPKLEPKAEPKVETKEETEVELKAEPKEEAKEEKSKRLLGDAWDETFTPNKVAKEEKKGLKWEEFLDIVGKEGATLRALLESVPKPEERDNKMVFLLEEDYPLLTSAYRDKLKDLVLKFFGKEVEFEVKKKRRDPEEVKNRPEVQTIMNIFSAKIAYIQPAKGE
ncbi:MAG: DNA polymerase III subunit gamma/tau [Thermodesulfobacteriaceae bacterium]|jgi:DNA polymerase-3 subunit gamma/tau